MAAEEKDMQKFHREKHLEFVKNLLFNSEGTPDWYLTEHLRMQAMFWSLSTLYLYDALDMIEKEKMVDFVLNCQSPEGGFSANVNHDPDLTNTLSALQILTLLDSLEKIDQEQVVSFLKTLIMEDGSVKGDKWGEIDTRFSYSLLLCLNILQRQNEIDVNAVAEYVGKCRNFDGGFGTVPGAESHSGQIFCCVAALVLSNRIDLIDVDVLCWWLVERQLPTGGLNGRPEKLQDVCYSWWVVSALHALDRLHWLDSVSLQKFILSCQYIEDGGIADRPGDMPDIYHLFFGSAGLSLIGKENLKEINPVWALPEELVTKIVGGEKAEEKNSNS